MKSLLFLIILLSGLKSHAQSSTNDKVDFESLKGKLSLPVDRFCSLQTYDQFRERLKNDLNYAGCTPPSKSLTIQSDSTMLAKSSASGKVIAVFNVDEIYAVIIQHGKYSFCYANLDTIFVKKGDSIGDRQSIGKVLSSSNNGMYELELLMKDKEGKDLDPYHWFINNQFL